MKVINKVMLPLISIAFLASCGTAASADGKSADGKSASVEIVHDTVEVDKTYSITIDAEEGSLITLETEADSQGRYIAGTAIAFTLEVNDPSKYLIDVYLDGIPIDDRGFVMPNHDVVLSTKLGDKAGDDSETSLITSPDAVPSDAASLKQALIDADKVEGRYLASASYSATKSSTDYSINPSVFSTGSSYSGMSENIKLTVGENTTAVEGHITTNDFSSRINPYFYQEKTIQDGFYGDFSVVSSSNGTDPLSSTMKVNSFSKIVADDRENVSSHEIKASDAHNSLTTFGFGSRFADILLDNAYSGIQAGAKEEFIRKVSSDKQSYTIDYKNHEYSSSNTTLKTYEMVVTIDGDGFLLGLDFRQNTYTKGVTYHSEDKTYEITAGISPDSYITMAYHAIRGLRDEVTSRYDLGSLAVENYDVKAKQTIDGSSTSNDVTGNTVYANSTLSFTFTTDDGVNPAVLPYASYVKEADVAEVRDGTVYVKALGDFTVVFDNGLGKEKEISYTAIQPLPTLMTVKIDGEALNSSSLQLEIGRKYVISGQIAPALASQDIIVEPYTSSYSTYETPTIEDNKDGTYSLSYATAGRGSVKVSAKANTSLTSTLSITILEPITVENVKTNLLSKTLSVTSAISAYVYDDYDYKLIYYRPYVNFNEDGTVAYRMDKGPYSSDITKGPVSKGTYTITGTDAGVVIALSGLEAVNGVTLSNIAVLGNDSFRFTFSGDVSQDASASLVTRIDDLAA